MKRELSGKALPVVFSSNRGGSDYHEEMRERGPCRFNRGYDSYQGILKRVADMKLSGSLDSEEPSTESEKSECSSCRHTGSDPRRYYPPFEDASANGSTYEDESSASSFGGSDHCPPYEEIPTTETSSDRGSRYVRLSSAQEKNYMNLSRYPSELRENSCDNHNCVSRRSSTSSSSQYKNTDVALPKLSRSGSKRSSLYSNSDKEYSNGGVYPNADEEEEHDTERVTEMEKHQIEIFFRGLRTDMFVSSSLANLYVGWKDVEGKWSFKHTGIPVILLDRGDTKSRSKRRIQILLAERGTCFPLWKDTIDNLTSYRKAGEAFHTMHLSSDHRQIIGLSFDSSDDSDEFYNYISELTSNPENINISVPGSRKGKKKSSRGKKPMPLPQKDQISNPCLFEHVTSVAAKDKPMYTSLQTLLDKELTKEGYCNGGGGGTGNGMSDWRR